MDQREECKKVQATIKALEQQLSLCENSIKACELSALEAEKEIEDHFARCISAINTRKTALVKHVIEKVNDQSILLIIIFINIIYYQLFNLNISKRKLWKKLV